MKSSSSMVAFGGTGSMDAKINAAAVSLSIIVGVNLVPLTFVSVLLTICVVRTRPGCCR